MTTQVVSAETELQTRPSISLWSANLHGGELGPRIRNARANFGGGPAHYPDGNLITGSSEVLRLTACNIPPIGPILGTQKLILCVTDPDSNGFNPSERIRTGLRWAQVPLSSYPHPERAPAPKVIGLHTGRTFSTASEQFGIYGIIRVLTASPGTSATDLSATYVTAFQEVNTDAPDRHPVNIAHLALLLQPHDGPAAILILETWGLWRDLHYPVSALPIELPDCTDTTAGSRIIDIAIRPGVSWRQPLGD